MATLVLDASAALSWFMPGEMDETAQDVFQRAGAEGAIVPSLWWIEVGNTFLLAVRRQRMSREQRDAASSALTAMPIETDANSLAGIWTMTLALADRHALTLYDACDLELSYRLELPLASRDRALRRAAQSLGIDLVGL